MHLDYIDGVLRETVRRTQKNEIKPWRLGRWVIPPEHDTDFAATMKDVPDVYQGPSEKALRAAGMDETLVELNREARVPVPAEPD